jgi:hypothetical protein
LPHPPYFPWFDLPNVNWATSSIFLLLHPSLLPIFSLGPCSQTSSVCALPLMWETTFHTHTKTVRIVVLCILTFTFLDSRLKTKDSEPNGSKHSMLIAKYYESYQIKEDMIGRACSRRECNKKYIKKTLVRKPESKNSLGRLRRIWEHNIKTDLKESGGRVWIGFMWLSMETGGERK